MARERYTTTVSTGSYYTGRALALTPGNSVFAYSLVSRAPVNGICGVSLGSFTLSSLLEGAGVGKYDVM